MSSPATLFTPSPPLAAKVLEALIDPTQSLASVAAANSITLEALSLWISTPDIQLRLASTESTAAWRTRILATFNLDKSIQALSTVLENAQRLAVPSPHPSSPHSSSASPAPTPTPFQSALLQLRALESTRRAAAALISLARFKPLGPVPPTQIAHNAHAASQRSAHSTSEISNRNSEIPTPLAFQDIEALLSLLANHLPEHRDEREAESPNAPAPARNESPAPPTPRSTQFNSAFRGSDIRHPTSDIRHSPATLLQAAGSPRAP